MKENGVWVDELKGLPLIVVKNTAGHLLATNLTEPHRIASSYILGGKLAGGTENLRKLFEEKIGLENRLENDGEIWPLDKRANLEKLVFALDPAALLHGFQFVQWKFVGLRQTRLIHARLEAELADDPEVHYGMVKLDAIEPESTRKERANKGQSIAAKSRIVPKNVTATFEIDVLALKNLSLKEDRKKFLLGLALWKIGAFLANKASFDPRSSQPPGPSLRLRADCYLTCESISWSGNSSKGQTTPTELMNAKPAGLGSPEGPSFEADTTGSDGKNKVTFSTLVKKLFSDKEDETTSEKPEEGESSGEKGAVTEKESSAEQKAAPLYEGTMVEVTYEPKQNQENKPKQEKKGGSKAAQQTEANVEQADEAADEAQE